MAQTNFTPILIYKSDTASSVPSASNLTNSSNGAELAVNTADKRLFTKDSGGGVVELGTNPSSLTLPNSTANGVFYANGSKALTSGSALTFDGTNLDITGTATMDGLTVSGASTADIISTSVDTMRVKRSTAGGGVRLKLENGDANYWNIQNDGAEDLSFGYNGTTTFFKLTEGGDISFYEDTGTTAKFFWDASAESLGIGTSSPGYSLDVNSGSGQYMARFSSSYAGRNYLLVQNTVGANNGRGAGIKLLAGDNDVLYSVDSYHYSDTLNANTVHTQLYNGSTTGYQIINQTDHRLFHNGTKFITMDAPNGVLAINDDGADIDFRVESDTNTHALFVEGSSGNVGIGTSSPNNLVQIKSGANGSGLTIQRSSTTADDYAQLGFFVSTTDSANQSAWIRGVRGASANLEFLTFGTADTERLRIDSSGNVGIGTSSPISGSGLTVADATYPAITIASLQNNASWTQNQEYGKLAFYSSDASALGAGETAKISVIADTSSTTYPAGALAFFTSNRSVSITITERARIDSSGNLLVGKTSTSTSSEGALIGKDSGGCYLTLGYTGTGTVNSVAFFRGTSGSLTQVGSISTTGSATAYNTSSDYRLKDNIQDITGSGAFIDALQPRSWNWKVDGSAGAGFIAHELQAVSPSSVVGEKDAVDADGNPEYQAVEYGSAEVIAMLVAEVKSLRARLTAAGL